MFIKTFVFRGDRSLYQRGGKLIVTYKRSVLYMISGKDFSFLRYYLGGKFGVRILQFLNGRNIGKGPYQAQQGNQRQNRSRDENPEPLGNSFLILVCHIQQKNFTLTRP